MKTSSFIGSGLLAGLLMTSAGTLVAQQSSGPEKKFGLGFMLGEPTGINAKYWLSENSAIDGMVGISWQGNDDFTTHLDYLYHLNDLFSIEEESFTVYFGGGPRFKVRDQGDDIFGIRTVGGVAYMLKDAPVDLFAEAGPVFDFTPDFEVRYTIAIGARFWF